MRVAQCLAGHRLAVEGRVEAAVSPGWEHWELRVVSQAGSGAGPFQSYMTPALSTAGHGVMPACTALQQSGDMSELLVPKQLKTLVAAGQGLSPQSEFLCFPELFHEVPVSSLERRLVSGWGKCPAGRLVVPVSAYSFPAP